MRMIHEEGLVGIEIGGRFFVSGYYSPNVDMDNCYTYLKKIDRLINSRKNKLNNVIIAGDINAKSTLWHCDKTDKKEKNSNGNTDQKELDTDQSSQEICVKGKSKSFLDIMNVSRTLTKFYKKVKVPNIFNSSDHLYVAYVFYNKTNDFNRRHFNYKTKDLDLDKLFNKYDATESNLSEFYLLDGSNQEEFLQKVVLYTK
jgi:hypothetical protein